MTTYHKQHAQYDNNNNNIIISELLHLEYLSAEVELYMVILAFWYPSGALQSIRDALVTNHQTLCLLGS